MAHTYTYIVEFKGGTYCSQTTADDLKFSLYSWLEIFKKQKEEIQFLLDETLKEIGDTIEDEDYQPVLLEGLKNTWFTNISTKQGSLYITIVKTDMS